MIKRPLTSIFCILFQFFLFIPVAGAQPAGASSPKTHAAFDKLVDEYFDFYFRSNPTAATQAGFHQYDHKLEDYSGSAVEAQIAGLTKFKTQFSAIQASELPEESRGDLEVLTSAIQASLLELQTIQMWRRDPDVYTSGVSYSVFLIMRRNFAPLDQRLGSVIAREREIPKALEAARQNLSNPPRVYTEVALQQLPDTIEFFRNDVPKAFDAVKNPKLLADFKASNDGVCGSIDSVSKISSQRSAACVEGRFSPGGREFQQEAAVRRDA